MADKQDEPGPTVSGRAPGGDAGGETGRIDPRVSGPFDGHRVDVITTPLRIHDLSRSGCLIQSYHEQAPGRRFMLEIELPFVGVVTLEVESVYSRADYGFAVRFVGVSDETQRQIDDVIARLLQQQAPRG